MVNTTTRSRGKTLSSPSKIESIKGYTYGKIFGILFSLNYLVQNIVNITLLIILFKIIIIIIMIN